MYDNLALILGTNERRSSLIIGSVYTGGSYITIKHLFRGGYRISERGGGGGGGPGNCLVLKCGLFTCMRATFFPSLCSLGVQKGGF